MKRTLSLLVCGLCVCSLGLIAGCSGSSAPIVVAFPAGTAPMLDAGQSQNFTIMLTHDTKNMGVTWSLASAGTLSNATPTSVTYNAPAGPLTASVTDHLTATSVADKTKSVTVAIVITASPAISTTSLPAGMEGTAYNQTVAVTGGAGTLTYAISVGTLPAGLSLSGSTGAITGTPTGPNGTASFTVKVTDSSTGAGGPQSATKALSIIVNLPPAPSITTTSLPNATQGAAYSQTIAATGGLTPYTFSIVVPGTGTLPAGLTLSSAGVISGTPTGLGTSSFTVKLTDSSNPSQSATQNLSIKVVPAPVAITTTSLPNAIVNATYSATLQATGGAPPITWSWTAQAGSTLPAGLILSPAGTISGTPTSAGTFNVSVTATDSSTPALTASKNFTITIIPQLVITTSSPLPNGITNTAYTGVTLASTGGSGAIVWTLTGGTTLPANLSLNASSGAITGTPTTAGTFNFTVQAADSGTPQQKVTKSFSITILQQLVITTPAALPTGSVTTPYSVTLASSGGTGAVTWALASGSTLPGGLTLTSAGVLAGTPTTANTYNFSITATDSGAPPQTATVAFTLTITPKLAITTTQSQIPSGTVGTAYNTPVQTNNGGIAPRTWSWIAQAGSSLPPGLNINSSTGVISGTPTSAGAFNVTVNVADSSSPTAQTASANFIISIATAPLSVATTGLPNGVVGQAYNNATLQSAGGNPPVTWSISVGSLPSWASLSAATGAITGTPTATGVTNFTVKATDSSTPTAQTATKALSITVVSALSITTTQSQIPGGTVGSAYNTTIAATGGTTPYTWSWAAQTGSSLPPGLNINSGTGAISGTPSSQGTFNVTVLVTDSGTPQQNASANFSITVTVATLTVTTTSNQLPSGTVNTAYNNTNLTATGGIPPYTWAVTTGTLPIGLTLSPSGTISGTPTTAGTSNFTVTVTDSATPAHTANANLSITVSAAGVACGSGHESVFKGQYAFLFQGFDASGPVAIGGIFSADGTGKIALLAGVIDINNSAGVQTNVPINSIGSSFSVGADNRGCLTIATGSVTFKYAISLGSLNGSSIATKGRMIEVDSTGTLGSGVLRLQDSAAFSTSAFVGSNFAFGAASTLTLSTAGANRFAVLGSVTVNSSSSITGEEDFNFSGQVDGGSTTGAAVAITGGSLSVAANGRGTLSLTVGASGSFPGGTFNFSAYVVSATEFLFMNIGAQSQTNPLFAGSALKQSGPFSASSLNANMVLYSTGICSTCGSGGGAGPQLTIGVVTISSPNNFSLTADQNSGGVLTSSFTFAGTYTVDASGRVLITRTGHTIPGLAVYLVSPNQGFFGSTGTDVNFGFGEPQTGGPNFTNASLSGAASFGTTEKVTQNVSDNSGVANFNGTGTVSGTSDQAGLGSAPKSNAFSQPYSVTNGTGTPGRGTITQSGAVNLIFYIISPSKIVLMDGQPVTSGGTADPALIIGEK